MTTPAPMGRVHKEASTEYQNNEIDSQQTNVYSLLNKAKSYSRFIKLEAKYYVKKRTQFAVTYHGKL